MTANTVYENVVYKKEARAVVSNNNIEVIHQVNYYVGSDGNLTWQDSVILMSIVTVIGYK